MVCHRWTLVLILICIPLLVTVISAFRVRLPGISPDAKSNLKKQKCENCDVNEPNLDQNVNSLKKEILKRTDHDTKKSSSSEFKTKQSHVIESKVNVPKQKTAEENPLKKDVKKPLFTFEFDDDDSDDMDNELDEESDSSLNLKKTKSSSETLVSKEKKYREALHKSNDQTDDNDEASVEDDDDNDDDDDDNDDDNGDKSGKNDEDDDDGNGDDDNDDDDDDDNDNDDNDEDSYEKMIKLIKKRTSEAVKSLSSEERGHGKSKTKDNKIEKLKLTIHTQRDSKQIDKTKPNDLINKNIEAEKAKEKKVKDVNKDELNKIIHENKVEKMKLLKVSVDAKIDDKVKSDKVLDEDKSKVIKKKEEKVLLEKEKPLKIEDKKPPLDKINPIKISSEKKSLEKEEKDNGLKIKSKIEIEKIPRKVEEKNKFSDNKVKDREDSIKNIEKVIKKQESKKIDFDDKTKKNEKQESDIQYITDALKRRNLLQSEFEDIYAFLPSFAPNFSRVHNSECRRHGQILLRQLRGTKLWALNMLDATAKIPSGLLQGNGIQLGDFDQCLATRARVQLDTGSVVKIQGKYCLATLDLKANHPELEMPVYLAQGKGLFRSRLDDPGHFVPRFSTLSWGVCIPSPCNPEDVEVMIRDAIKHYQKKLGLLVRVKVEEEDCYVREGGDWWKDWIDLPTVLTLSFYLIIILLVLIATIQDYLSRKSSDQVEEDDKADESKNNSKDDKESSGGFLQPFSLYNTINKLIAPGNDKEIACIHGLRAVATVALLIAHKFLPVGVTPYTNRLKISEIVKSPLLSWCRAGWIFTDCFLLLSGTLTSYRTSKEDSVVAKLLSKYLRLTPALLAVVLFYAYIWDNISAGPMWGSLVTRNAEICRDSWWWNILYVQNYLGFESMCAPQTHQLALDLQLTVIGGVIVWAIQSEILLSGFIMPTLHLLSAYSRYTTFRDHRLTALAYQGVSVSQLYRTGSLSYISAFHRCTPYLIGLSLGLTLRKPSRMGKLLNILGWLVCVALYGLVLWAGADSGDLQYRYDVTFAAQYATFAPFAVGLAFAWLIFAVHNGYFGLLSSFLSSRPLLFISRISYALYLTQFIVFLTNSAMVKTSQEFTIISLFDLQEISSILLVSIVLSLLFIIPFQSLPRISFSFKNENESQDESSSMNGIQNKESDSKIEANNIEKEKESNTQSFMAHRDVPEEIPEAEVGYDIHRETNEGLEEIIEEEEDELDDEMIEHIDDEDLEVIEEEQGGEDDWIERNVYEPRYSMNNQDSEEWEWTDQNDRTGAQKYRYSR